MAKKNIWMLVQLIALSIIVAGCNTGAFQIEMISADKELKESQVHKDKGFFVFFTVACRYPRLVAWSGDLSADHGPWYLAGFQHAVASTLPPHPIAWLGIYRMGAPG